VLARRTAEDQRREIAHLEAMLRGEGMPAVEAPSAPLKDSSRNAAAPAPRGPNAEPKAAPAQRPARRDESAPRSAPRPAPTPTPPTPTCAPEHRAAGHC
jgi:hypothetical protein